MKCPTCRRSILWNDEYPFRPFCSERCRLVDLGAWLSQERAIPGESLADDADVQDAERAAHDGESSSGAASAAPRRHER